jgi:hypothetical protein
LTAAPAARYGAAATMSEELRAQQRRESTTDDRVWHPWVRVNRIIRDVLAMSWDSDDCPVAKFVLRRTLTERSRTAPAGWFS